MPFDSQSKLLLLFGAGSGAEIWADRNEITHQPVLILDNNPNLWGSTHAGMRVANPSVVLEIGFRKILILVAQVPEVVDQLRGLGVPNMAIEVPPKPAFRPQPFATRKGREQGLVCLEQLLYLAEKSGLHPVVEQGAALGLFRDGALIEWDNDLDISFRHEECSLIPTFATKFEESGLFTPLSITELELGVLITFRTLEDGIPVTFYSRKIIGTEWVSADASFIKVPRNCLFPPRNIKIDDFDIPIPNDPETYFTSIYGENWRTPRPNFSFSDYAQQSG